MSNREVNQPKPKILVFCDYYLPGYKSGGGMRTIVNMIDRLNDRFDFWVVTRDHDGKLDRRSYKNVSINSWNSIRHAKVFYLSKENIKISKLRELILFVKPETIYFNSYFATLTIYVLLLRRFKLIPNLNMIVAPCGELSDGGLSLNAAKKKSFTRFAKLSKIYQKVIWKASSVLEKNEIERIKDKGGKIFIVPDLSPKTILPDFDQISKPRKISGKARLIFLSRFMRKKNFRWLLEHLSGVEGDLEIDIFGPLEDENYWEECRQMIKTLPPNLQIAYKGSIPNEEVGETLLNYQFFILPTLGENFGHVFIEALAAGCPLIISDRTPWSDLKEKEIGWDLPLEKPEKWLEVLNYCINLDDVSYSKLSSQARNFACQWLSAAAVEEDTLEVLRYSLSKAPTGSR